MTMFMENRAVVLVSGGVDSFIAYRYILNSGRKDYEEVIPLFVEYGSRYWAKELSACRRLYGKDLVIDSGTLNLNSIEVGENAFIKNRNAFLALVASNYGNAIFMGGLKDDNVGDKTPLAFLQMGNLLNTINDDSCMYSVDSPFWSKTKIDILRWYINNGFDIHALQETVSCYAMGEIDFCGKCPACFRRYCAFSYLNLPVAKFNNAGMALHYYKNRYNYPEQRRRSIKIAVQKMGLI